MTTENMAAVEMPAAAESAGDVGVEASEGIESSEGTEVEASDDVVESAPAPKNNSLYEVVIDGQKLMVTQEQLLSGFQTNAAAMERFKQAAELRKQAEKVLSVVKDNPLQAFIEAGGNPSSFRELVEQYLYDQIQLEKMSPEEKELHELRRYREEQEQARQAEAKRREEEALSQQAEIMRDRYTKSFTEALTGAGLPSSEKAIASIAQIQLDALEQGYELPIEVAVNYYKDQQLKAINDYLGGLGTEQLIETLGGRIKDIKKHELAGLKNPPSKSKKSSQPSEPKSNKISASEFFASLK